MISYGYNNVSWSLLLLFLNILYLDLLLLSFNQWKNSDIVIKWFSSVKIKSQCAFIQLGIMKFYLSITETILDNALSFAKQHVEISDKDLRIIKHCRKSLFYHESEAQKKKNSDDCFDVTMGSSTEQRLVNWWAP